jgi:hypothetical protein
MEVPSEKIIVLLLLDTVRPFAYLVTFVIILRTDSLFRNFEILPTNTNERDKEGNKRNGRLSQER